MKKIRNLKSTNTTRSSVAVSGLTPALSLKVPLSSEISTQVPGSGAGMTKRRASTDFSTRNSMNAIPKSNSCFVNPRCELTLRAVPNYKSRQFSSNTSRVDFCSRRSGIRGIGGLDSLSF